MPARRAPVLQRTEESEDLLTDLATPKTFVGPTVEIQTSIIRKLEAALVEEDARVAEINRGLDPLAPRVRPRGFYDLLFLGGIELLDIAEDDEEMIEAAELVSLEGDNALDARLQSFDLVTEAGVGDEVVENTLRTMIAARQIEYLRASGFVGEDWKIVIEVHYYRRRSQSTSQFHKDTLGQTLFVNLNYQTSSPIAGPEYLLNPPLVAEHEERTAGTLPAEFRADLAVTRERLGAPTTIGAPVIPAYGVVAFVDEAMHHMTPHRGHRTVKGRTVGEFVRGRHPVEYGAAERDYAAYEKSWWAMWTYSGATYRRLRLIDMVNRPDDDFTRQDVVAAGIAEDDIEALLESHGGSGFQRVSIPRVQGPLPSVRGEGRPPLKRRMSELALAKTLPPAVSGDRTFFRTWVRAVRR